MALTLPIGSVLSILFKIIYILLIIRFFIGIKQSTNVIRIRQHPIEKIFFLLTNKLVKPFQGMITLGLDLSPILCLLSFFYLIEPLIMTIIGWV